MGALLALEEMNPEPRT